MMRGGIARANFGGTLEFLLRASPVPIVSRANGPQRCMRFRQAVVDGQRFLSSLACERNNVCRSLHSVNRLGRIAIGQPRQSCCKLGVHVRRLPETSNAFLQILRGSLVPEKAALEIKVVSVGMPGGAGHYGRVGRAP